MAEHEVQNYSNHVRIDPSFFYVLAPAFMVALVCGIIGMVREPSWTGVGFLILTVTSMGHFLKTRIYSVKVQDRVVRLEERLRLERVLPEALRPRIGEFSLKQLIALRFASDEELPALAERVLNEGITDGKVIKQAVKTWRADFHRV